MACKQRLILYVGLLMRRNVSVEEEREGKSQLWNILQNKRPESLEIVNVMKDDNDDDDDHGNFLKTGELH